MDGKPLIEAGDAVRIARERYGLRATAVELPSYADRNFRIDADGETYVLKVSHADVGPAALEFQTALCEHAARRDGALRLPQAVASSSGRKLEIVRDAAGRDLPCRLVSWVPGRPLRDVRPRDRTIRLALGAFLGRLDRALEGLDHPGARHELLWDLKRTGELRRHSPDLANEQRREIAEWLFLQFDAAVAPALDALPHAVVHNDANDDNVLLVADGPSPELGIIDFGDALWSLRAAEPAIACAYAMLDEEHPLDAAAEVVRGYHEVRPLTAAEFDVLFHLVRSRLLASVCQSAHAARSEPENEYIRVSEAPAWRLLERLVEIAPGDAREVLARGCGLERAATRPAAEILELRRRHVGPALSLSYEEPLSIVRGNGPYLHDSGGRAFLDLVNNVCHVGHAHPRVVEAARAQMAALNTNTRYLHRHIVEYARRLAATLPDGLDVCYFVNSGSEANELALRLARAATGATDFVVLEGGYHGNTSSLIELSPYKFAGPGGGGRPEHVHVAPVPDVYRGRYREDDAGCGARYAALVGQALERAAGQGRRVAGFLCESLPGCAGQIVPPPGYLVDAYRRVRDAGGVCIADEVQVGFGRVGTHFWGFEAQGAVPDVVTLGKPIGNGHPLGAVVTTREIAAAFDNGMEYFNTFGGNPVACAVGLAVLDVIEEERLQARALEIGGRLLRGLHELGEEHPRIGDVRGMGLFLGLELVRDRESREPAPAAAAGIVEALKRRGFLLSTDGPDRNVIKIKPPLVIGRGDAELFLSALRRTLAE